MRSCFEEDGRKGVSSRHGGKKRTDLPEDAAGHGTVQSSGEGREEAGP